jgi:hypothetical protein
MISIVCLAVFRSASFCSVLQVIKWRLRTSCISRSRGLFGRHFGYKILSSRFQVYFHFRYKYTDPVEQDVHCFVRLIFWSPTNYACELSGFHGDEYEDGCHTSP